MRFLFVLDSYKIGGAERQAFKLASSLLDVGHEVGFVALTEEGKLSSLLDKTGIEHSLLELGLNFGKFNFPRIKNSLKKSISLFKPDVVLPYTYWPNLLSNLVWKKTTAKLCFWNQRDEIPFLNKKLEEKALSKTSFVVANSKGGRDHLKENFPFLDNISVIRNGISMDASYESNWESILSKAKNEVSVVMIANLQYRKDHNAVLEAWKHVVEINKELNIEPKLYFAGRFAGTHDQLKAKCFDLKFTNEVQFLGGVDDVKGLLEQMDLAVFASFHEGSPNGILEPMSVGLAVVANRIAGNIEALGAENEGLVDSANRDQLVNKLNLLIKDTTKRKVLGDHNKNRIISDFGVENLKNQYLKLCKV
jgi:glycosyltransferase involved in cell wall biosynthesis